MTTKTKTGTTLLVALCLAAAAFGLASAVRGWRSGCRAEQLLCATIAINAKWQMPAPTVIACHTSW